jgi:hypothetical protein
MAEIRNMNTKYLKEIKEKGTFEELGVDGNLVLNIFRRF